VTAEKNAPGMSSFPSLVTSKYVLLSSCSDVHLLVVAVDVGMAINPSVGSPVELLSLVRTKEVAQALLAAAVDKQNLSVASEEAGAASLPLPMVEASAAPTVSSTTSAQLGVVVATPPLIPAKSRQRKKKPDLGLGPRTNLRKTPARQARVSNLGLQ
jgi:hypothetical protein